MGNRVRALLELVKMSATAVSIIPMVFMIAVVERYFPNPNLKPNWHKEK